MSRKSHCDWQNAKAKWPALYAILNAHFGERFWFDYPSVEAAREAVIAELDHRQRKQVLREWWDWNSSAGRVDDPRQEIVHFAELVFDSATEARAFMNDFYDAVIVEVRSKEPGWKP